MRGRSIVFLILVILVLVGGTISAHTGGEVQVRCPVCATRFTTTVTMSYSVMGRTHDLEQLGAVGSMYEDGVTSCPTCHYSWDSDNFEKSVDPDLEGWVIKTLRPRYATHAPDKVEAYRIMAEIAMRRQLPELRIGTIYLTDTYIIRHAHGPRSERLDLQAQAALHLQNALLAGEVKDTDLAVYHYLIGEMDRRQAKFDEALIWYEKATHDKSPGPMFVTFLADMQALARKKDDNNSI